MKSARFVCAAAALAALAIVASPADAAPVATTTQFWDVFSNASGGNNAPNDGLSATVDFVNPNGTPSIRYVGAPGAFVTSGGNIYNPGGVSAFEAGIPLENLGGGHETDVSFLVRTLGSELAYDDVSLTYTGAGGDETIPFTSRQEIARIALGGFGGFQVDTLFSFDVPFNPAGVTLDFAAAESSVSLDRVTIDTATNVALPEPAGLAGLAVGAVVLLSRRRRPISA